MLLLELTPCDELVVRDGLLNALIGGDTGVFESTISP
jgi:hypothetical protein